MNATASLPIIVIGGGGHAKVLLDSLKRLGLSVRGVVDNDAAKIRDGSFEGFPVLGGDDLVLAMDPGSILLVNGLGSVRRPALRRAVFERFKSKGFRFHTTVDPTAFIAGGVVLDEGAQIFARAVLQPGTRIGANSIVNTGAVIDHDCLIGPHCHIAPGAVLSGQVSLGEETHFGTGARVIQGVRIGSACTIGAGATVISDLPDGVVAVGVPARALELKERDRN